MRPRVIETIFNPRGFWSLSAKIGLEGAKGRPWLLVIIRWHLHHHNNQRCLLDSWTLSLLQQKAELALWLLPHDGWNRASSKKL